MMQNMFLPIMLTTVLLLACCACTDSDDTETVADTAETSHQVFAQSWQGKGDYTILLPQGFTAKDIEGEDAIVFRDGEEVGGISTFPFANAVQLLTMDNLSDKGREVTEELVKLVSPEKEMAFLLNAAENGRYLTLSLSPNIPEVTIEDETIHYLFPEGDKIYDLFFQANQVPAEQQQLLVDGFVPREG